MILLLGFVMFVMSHIGYKVGLSAHGRSVTMENSSGLYFILTCASVALSAAYFVIFHSLDGRTIGKWIFGLRVVGAENGDVTSRQASFALACRCWFCADSFRFLVGDLEPREKGLARHHRPDMGDQGVVAASAIG